MTLFPASPEPALLLPVLPICAWVAWSDLARMTIPNRAVLMLVAAFVVLGPFALPWPEFAARWLNLAVVLAVAFGLFAARLIGGGDAKLLAAMALFVPASDATAFLLLTTLVLLVTSGLHRAARATAGLRGLAPGWESWNRREFPMGLPLGLSLALHLVLAAA